MRTSFAFESIVDLTHTISGNTRMYPGDAPPEFNPTNTIDVCGYENTYIKLSSHTATHIDSPAHIYPNKDTIESYAADKFFGKATLVDYLVEPKHTVHRQLKNICKRKEHDFILFYTEWDKHWNTDKYFLNAPYLDKESVKILMDCQLKGVGFDFPSPDAIHSKELFAHKKLLGKDVLLIENLVNLHLLLDKDFYFCCLPLKLEQCDASPVRAVALLQ